MKLCSCHGLGSRNTETYDTEHFGFGKQEAL